MYEKLTPKEYVLEEREIETENDVPIHKEDNSEADVSAAPAMGAQASAGVASRGRGLFGGGGGGLGGLFNKIGIEELLLIGLILLLVFEDGEFDMILILIFLFLCGLDL